MMALDGRSLKQKLGWHKHLGQHSRRNYWELQVGNCEIHSLKDCPENMNHHKGLGQSEVAFQNNALKK